MAKYKYYKRQIKSLIKFGDDVAAVLRDQVIGGFVDTCSEQGLNDIRTSVVSVASAIPKRFETSVSLAHFEVGQMVYGQPIAEILITKKQIKIRISIEDFLITVNKA